MITPVQSRQYLQSYSMSINMLARSGNRPSNESLGLWSKEVMSTNTTCGTHVHLSPRDKKWHIEDLRKLSCCVLYFEGAFEVSYPEAERNLDTLPDVISWRKEYTENAQKSKRAEYVKANWADNRRFEAQYADNVDLIDKTKNPDRPICGTKNHIEAICATKDPVDLICGIENLPELITLIGLMNPLEGNTKCQHHFDRYFA
ncbi:uncharacterized protein BDZ99DRAFT_477519 [Mytilinidion resinicola]|uniref:Uncharacterized protein n=1 Tax=Mytilinidion resinicola TaxID=574789 RepID=A0A6A6YME0_9PEZI|nr:uncharacterized protein BDZ99DRAFT_477519 [Mytilinidion resinicola]KAF2809037.1 hypothetical protein BDZ99DRAFT_477519 [Mytilinidion resinicola]